MSYVPIIPARYAPDAPVATNLFGDIVNDLDYLHGLSGSSDFASNAPLVVNGSFELNAEGANPPYGWFPTPVGLGTGQVSDDEQYHGGKSYRATHPGGPGNGGMTLDSNDFFPVSFAARYDLIWAVMASDTNVMVEDTNVAVTSNITWYDDTQNAIGSMETLRTLTKTPTAWTAYRDKCVPPEGAVWAKIRFVLGESSVDPGTSTNIYLDTVSMVYSRAFTNGSQKFTSTTDWVVPAGIYVLKCHLWGGGCVPTSQGHGAGLPGGSGGYCEGLLPVSPGQNLTITVGEGGTTAFGGSRNGGKSEVSSQGVVLKGGGGVAGTGSNAGTRGDASGGYLNFKASFGENFFEADPGKIPGGNSQRGEVIIVY